jgi:hypothetical protein
MNEKFEDGDVLLVKEKGSNELKVAGMEKDGKVKNHKADDGNNPDFLRIDKNGNVLENFFENFMRQAKNPTQFEFFRVPMEKFQEVIRKLQDAFKNPKKQENKEFIDLHRVDPEAFLKKQQQTQPSASAGAIDENRVDWSQFEKIGINRDFLEKTGNLTKLLNRQKTDLMPITIKTGELTIRTDARMALRESPDGALSIAVHALRKEPELERPYFGVKLSEEDRQNLLKTGNLGRIAEAEYTQGVKTPVFISIDKQTNELVAFRADRVNIPENIKGVNLNDREKQDLSAGKAIFRDDFISKAGKTFSAYLQFNADRRGLEFRFDNDRKQEQNQQQGNAQKDAPRTFRKNELTGDQRDSLREGKTVYIDGLEDKKGKKYSGYITVNKETGKTDFMFPKDYKEALAAGKVIPDDRHKTQVAVNSEGKTNEATKKVNEPLEKGQTKPTEKQEAKQDEQKQKNKRGQNI